MKACYGFTRPYHFERALPFLAAIVLLLLILSAAGLAASSGKLSWATHRSAYMLYLGALAVVGAGLAFRPRLAWAAIALCVVESSLAAAPIVLAGVNVAGWPALLPAN